MPKGVGIMQCPRCAYQNQATTVQCPRCRGTYPHAELEEIGHLRYTHDRLDHWWTDGTLPARLAQHLIALIDAETRALQQRLAPAAPAAQIVAGPVPDDLATALVTEVARHPVSAHGAALAAPPATATVPLVARPPAGSQPAPARAAQPAKPAKPPRPAFSWRQVGVYLLSERTLNALLGLGAFLILAAAVVISTVNPTGLAPLPHLAAMLCTTLVFYGAGAFVQQRLRLMHTGAVLLAIGAAFVPLDLWTLGRDILILDPRSIWVLASVVCLPLYLASHLWLRDRAFALLTAVAGVSLVLSLTHTLGIAPIWGGTGLIVLSIVYLALGHRLRRDWEHLCWALFWTAQIAVPAAMASLLALRFVPTLSSSFPPAVWVDVLGAHPGASLDYAVGAAWWLGVAFYALAARLFAHRGYAFAAAWALPAAYLFTLTRAPFGAAWYGPWLAILAAAYLAFGRGVQRLPVGVTRPGLGQLLQQPVYQVCLVLSLVAGLWPAVTLTGAFVSPAEALSLWLLVGVYAAAACTFRHVAFRYVAAYLIPVALALTPAHYIARLPDMPSLGIAALAACYLLFGRFALGMARLGDRTASYLAVAREPVCQVAWLLTLVAALWPAVTASAASGVEVATLLAVALLYGGAAFLLGQRAWAHVAAYLLPVAGGLAMARLGLDDGATILGWALQALALLAAAEVAARRAGEGRRPLLPTVIGLGQWRSRFASPLFSVAYAATLPAIAIGLGQGAALSHMPATGIAGLLLVVAVYAASSPLRRTSVPLYPATWLFLAPFSALAAHAYDWAGWGLTLPHEARLLALLGLGYLALAGIVDRARGHYARPLYLAAYALLALGIALGAGDRAVTVQTMGLAVLGCAYSALLVHRGKHPSSSWLVACLCSGAATWVLDAAEMLFQYLAVWLFPVWLLLLQSLRQPAPAPADYGMALALLAPLYAALGLGSERIHAAYRLPWLLGGFALSALGPLLALPDPTLRVAALAVSISLYVAAALQSRRHEWLWLAALLGPVLLLEIIYGFGDPARAYGIALVALSLGYGALGLVVQRRGLRERPKPFALPFLAIGQALCVLGLVLAVATGDTGLVLIGFCLGALHYAAAAAVSRRGEFAAPLAISLAVVYVCALLRSPLPVSGYGLGLLPGLVAFLVMGEVFRRVTAGAGRVAERSAQLSAWSTPSNAILHLGVVASFTLSGLGDGSETLTWWGLTALYLALAALRRRPGPLYPAIGLALASYLATASLLAPGTSAIVLVSWLTAPVWLLFCLAHALGRAHSGAGTVAPWHLRWSGRAGADPWARPLLVWGAVVLVYSAVRGGIELPAVAPLELAVTVSYAILLAGFSLLWQSRSLVWMGIALAALACQETLALAAVSAASQPVYWAGAAMIACLAGSGLRRLPGLSAGLWAVPLLQAAVAASALAICLAAGNLAHGRLALQPLAATLAVIGLAALTEGIAGRQPHLRYLGLGLLNGGYICELLFRQVGEPQTFALPLGLTLLLAAYLEWRRGAARARTVLEIAALLIILGTTLVQGCGGLGVGSARFGYDTFLLLESVAVFGLGAVLRWKRTFFAACAAIVADVVILLADPLRAMGTWYLMAIIGCAMIGLVVFLEQRRQQIPLWIDEVRVRLESWD